MPELEDYGVDAVSVAELEALLDACRKRMPSTRMAISHRRKGTQRLAILFREADRLLVEEPPDIFWCDRCDIVRWVRYIYEIARIM